MGGGVEIRDPLDIIGSGAGTGPRKSAPRRAKKKNHAHDPQRKPP